MWRWSEEEATAELSSAGQSWPQGNAREALHQDGVLAAPRVPALDYLRLGYWVRVAPLAPQGRGRWLSGAPQSAGRGGGRSGLAAGLAPRRCLIWAARPAQ